MTIPSTFPQSLRLALVSICLSFISLTAGFAASIALDQNFNPPFFGEPAYAGRAKLLSDGSYLLYFNISSLTDQPTGGLMKFAPDGTFDSSFDLDRKYNAVFAVAELPNGQLIVAASQSIYGVAEFAEHIFRLNTDGSIDSTFNPTDATITAGANGADVRNIVVQPDGRILVAGYFGGFGRANYPDIVRLLADGTLDETFAAVSFEFNDPFVVGLRGRPLVQPDGKIIIAGDFDSVNGTLYPGVARLNADGTLDTTFNPSGFVRFNTSPSSAIRGTALQPDGKIILGGRFNVNNNGMATNVIRLNADGSLDQTFIPSLVNQVLYDLALQPDGKIVTAQYLVQRFNSDGSPDASFHIPTLSDTPVLNFGSGLAVTVDLQDDGRILIGGDFDDVDDPNTPANSDHWSVARLNADGTLDTTLTTSHKTGYPHHPESFTRRSDGSTLIGFAGFGLTGPVAHNFGRLLPDGSLDSGFNPVATFDPNGNLGPDFVLSLFNQLADGSLLVFGLRNFDEFGDSDFAYGKLLGDLTEDRDFIADSGAIVPVVPFTPQIFPFPDGRTLLDWNPTNYAQPVVDNTEIRRVNADGTLDDSFVLDPAILNDTVARDNNGVITSVAVGGKVLDLNSDGTIFLSYLAVDDTFRLVRLTSNGSLDASFPIVPIPATVQTFEQFVSDNGNSSFVTTTVPLSPGFADVLSVAGNKIIVTGDFPTYAGVDAHGIVRLNSNGSVDTSFQSGGGAQWTDTMETETTRPAIDNIELENDGKFLISGTFEAYDGNDAPGLATLNSDGSFFQALGSIATRAKYNLFFFNKPFLARQPDGSFYLSGPYVRAGETEEPSFIHINSFGGVPIIGSPLIASGTQGEAFSYQIVASGQPTGYGASGLPAGLMVDSASGLISGVPSVGGTFNVDLSATNAEGTGHATLVLTIASTLNPPVITSPTTATATVGAPFTYQITATNSPTSFGATGLPAGLNVNTTSGLISGTPTGAGVFSVTLSATNSAGTGMATLTLTINPAAPVVTSPSSATATAGVPFLFQIVATNSPTSYGATNLPAGLTVDTALGLISGTPTTAGTSMVTLMASNAGGTGSKLLILTVQSGGGGGGGGGHGTDMLNDGPNTARTDEPFSFQVLATGVSSDATYSAEGLPDGLTINPETGIISGTPTEEGSFAVIITITDGENSSSFTLQLTFTSDPGFPVIISPGSATLVPGQPFSYTIEAPVSGVGEDDTTIFSLVGELPPGLTFDAATGTISGTYTPSSQKAISAPGTEDASVPSDALAGSVLLVATNSHGTATKTLVFVQAVPRLLNISTRVNVGTRDNVMIGGFIVTGNAPKKLLLRAIGPSLSEFGLSDVLADPVLELHKPDGTVVTNDNWKETQQAEIEATKTAPKNDLESAMVVALDPVDPAVAGSGLYTAIVRGKDDGTGIGLVEAYDLDAAADSQLGNISTRGFVDKGDNVMIGGVITGGTTGQVLVRAIGPELSDFGVSGALEDTVLELHDKDGNTLVTNDDWKETQQAAIEATGIPPKDDRESAILMTLEPNNYTAVVRGKGDTTGVALVEVYNVTP